LSTLVLEGGSHLDCRGENAPDASARPETTSQTSLRGLDWFTFFLADIQTGFGPFVAIYLTAHEWAQLDIGLVLTTGGLIALIGQMPAGALVDAMRSARLAGIIAIAAICLSALALALWPVFPVVMASRMLHAGASCVLGPVIAALSLALVGHAALGARLGRNARFASLGNGIAAAAMGLCGYLASNQAVFLLTAALAAPAIVALAQIRTNIPAPSVAKAAESAKASVAAFLGDRRLLVFAGCVLLFQLANSAMLPLMGGILTVRSGASASALMAACIVLPQIIVACCAPAIGRQADVWGRKPLLLLCFAGVAIRGVLFAFADNPFLVVPAQALDGISAAVLGVCLPLIAADVTRASGRFNLALGIIGTAVGIGAALSTTLAGFAMDRFGAGVAFGSLACIAVCGLVSVWLLLPETRPE
jgi:MFS family permease